MILSGLMAQPGGAAAAADGVFGSIRGIVEDRDFRTPLGGVRVVLVEARQSVLSTREGMFLFELVPTGTYTLSLSRDGYEREVLTQVLVQQGRLTDLSVQMSSEVVEMEELVVSGEDLLSTGDFGLLEIRATAVAVQDSISSDLISKAGAGDVAGALKMVVGTSVASGKYATVRGLSDRYTGTTLNGVRIPSADPRVRAVQMDLFPTGTVESVTVTKTFTPELQGDFTGGGVDIKTKSIPDGFTLSVAESVGYNTLATGNEDRLTYIGGGVDGFAIDSGGRALPGGANRGLPGFPVFSSRPSASQVESSMAYDRLVRSFSPVMGVSEQAPGANYGFSLLAGDRFQLGEERVFGLMGGLTYARKYDSYDNGTNNNAAVSVKDQPITITKPRTDSRGTDELLIGGLASAVFKLNPRHELGLRYVLNRSAEDEARFQIQRFGSDSVEQNQSLHYTERSVSSTQLSGTHTFQGLDDLLVEWLAAANSTRQDEPDVRFFRNVFSESTQSGEMPSNSTDAQNTRRVFREIEEKNRQAGLNVTLPFLPGGEREGRFKMGFFLDRSDRGYDQKSLTYHFPTQLGSTPAAKANRGLARFQATRVGELWTDVFLDPERIGLASNMPPAKNQLLWTIVPLGDDVDYTGDQSIEAIYGMAEVPLGPKLKLTGGVRYETTDLSIDPTNDEFGKVSVITVLSSGERALDPNVPQEEARASIKEEFLLPSINFAYEVLPNMNVRASWARTIARPTFRELAPVATEEFIFGDEFFGNPNLTLSRITNYDLRWEWFRKPGEVLAFSAYYKELRDPIEMISFSTLGRSFIQPVNFEKGRVRGVEMEARAPLGVIWKPLRDFTGGLNVSWIDSEVDVPEQERRSLETYGLDQRSRRLQGQPDILINVNLTYDHERTGTSVGLFYNVVGETLVTGAARGETDGVPNVFEEPIRSLDFKVGRRLNERYSLSLRAQNLMPSARRIIYRGSDGEEVVKSERDTAVVYTVSGTVSW